MIEELAYQDEVGEKYISSIVDAAKKVYEATNKTVRILDIATGNNKFNPLLVERLSQEGVDFELVLTDISPTIMRKGYERIQAHVGEQELAKVKAVLADATDLESDLTEVRLYDEGKVTLDDVLKDPRFAFLQSGYEGRERTVSFDDQSFDLVVGCIPYSSITPGGYRDGLAESMRVLAPGGYHIVEELQVLKINEKAERTDGARRGSKVKYIDDITDLLDEVLEFVATFSWDYLYPEDEEEPDQGVQIGDKVRSSILIHQKT